MLQWPPPSRLATIACIAFTPLRSPFHVLWRSKCASLFLIFLIKGVPGNVGLQLLKNDSISGHACRNIKGPSFPSSQSDSAFHHSSSTNSLSNGVLALEQRRAEVPSRQPLTTY